MNKTSMLLSAFFSIFISSHINSMKLFDAIKNNNKNDVIKYINENGDLNVTDNRGSTPIIIAAAKGFVDIANIIFDASPCTYKRTDKSENTPLIYACFYKKLNMVMDIVKKCPNTINTINKNFKTALMYACKSGDEEIVAFLLENNAKVNELDEKLKTALMFAASSGSLPIVKNLIKAGADPNIQCENKKTAYDYALEKSNNQELLEYLKPLTIDHEKTKKILRTIFTSEHVKVFFYFIRKNGAFNVNFKDPNGKTALMHLCEKGNSEYVAFFVEKLRANIDIKDLYGYTALIHAGLSGHKNIVEYLIKHNASLEWDNLFVYSALRFFQNQFPGIQADPNKERRSKIIFFLGDINKKIKCNYNAVFVNKELSLYSQKKVLKTINNNSLENTIYFKHL